MPSNCYIDLHLFDDCIFLLLLSEILFYDDWHFVPYNFFKWKPDVRDWWVQSPVNGKFLPSDVTVIFHLSTRCLKCSSWKFLFTKFSVFLELLSIFWHLSNREIKEKKTILTVAWLSKESVFCPVPVIIDIVFPFALVSLLFSCHNKWSNYVDWLFKGVVYFTDVELIKSSDPIFFKLDVHNHCNLALFQCYLSKISFEY